MVDQLLWIDALAKFSFGLMFVLAPKPAAILLGLPREQTFFYARLLGAALFGLALALTIEGAGDSASGLGLRGAVAINLSGAAVLGVTLLFGRRMPARRGRISLWLTVFFLVGLSIAQSLYA